jgi:hypothetical protein
MRLIRLLPRLFKTALVVMWLFRELCRGRAISSLRLERMKGWRVVRIGMWGFLGSEI